MSYLDSLEDSVHLEHVILFHHDLFVSIGSERPTYSASSVSNDLHELCCVQEDVVLCPVYSDFVTSVRDVLFVTVDVLLQHLHDVLERFKDTVLGILS